MPAKTAKEKILKKIKQALIQPTPIPFSDSSNEYDESVYQSQEQETEVEFAENFTKLQGIFSYCLNEKELTDQLKLLIEKKQWQKICCYEDDLQKLLQHCIVDSNWHSDLVTCNASITSCELLIARTGSIVMSSAQKKGRTTSVYAPVHICIAYTDQLVYNIQEGLNILNKKYMNTLPSLITFATGPSRTADIEKTLVVGIHGPKEVYVFLVER